MRNNKGFSLVELMIVVAIIGILAAIAIPNFITMQLKAKRGELPGNVDGIKTAELAYDASFDGYVTATEAPRSIGGTTADKVAVPWDTAAVDGMWNTLNWKPDGLVRGNYAVAETTGPDFTVTANCNVDGDGDMATYTATTSVNATLDPADQNVF